MSGSVESLEDTHEEHDHLWDQVHDRYREDENILQCMRQHSNSLGLEVASSLLSIGPGTGILDSELIHDCLFSLQKYIAVDPSQELLEAVQTTIHKLSYPQVEVELVPSDLCHYKGPSEPVDLIFLIHALYYVKDYGLQCQRMFNWLSPGGSMIIVVNRGDGQEFPNMYTEMALSVGSDVPEAMKVNSVSVKKELENSGLSYKEYRVKTEILIYPGPSRLQLIRFILMKEPTQDEVDRALTIMRSYCKPGTDVCQEESCVIVVKKHVQKPTTDQDCSLKIIPLHPK